MISIKENGIYFRQSRAGNVDQHEAYYELEHNARFYDLYSRMQYDYGDGEDGIGIIAAIDSNLTDSLTVTNYGASDINTYRMLLDGVITVSGAYSATGNLADGDLWLKWGTGNLSGTTAPNTTPVKVTCAANSICKVDLPAGPAGTGFRAVYCATSSNGTYYETGRISNNDSTDSFWFNTTYYGASAPSSNTTSATAATKSGIWQCSDFTLESGQAVTVDTNGTAPGILIMKSTGTVNVKSGAIITGTGKFVKATDPGMLAMYSAASGYYGQGTIGLPSDTDKRVTTAINNTFIRNKQGGASPYKFGAGGKYSSEFLSYMTFAGASIIIIAKKIILDGSVAANGAAGDASNLAGASGGRVELWAHNGIDISGTVTSNGGNAYNSATYAGGGGGGLIVIGSPFYDVAGATIQANGGTGYGGGGAVYYNGGAHIGQGGNGYSTTKDGTAGAIVYIPHSPSREYLQGLLN